MWGSSLAILVAALGLIGDKLGDEYKSYTQTWAAFGQWGGCALAWGAVVSILTCWFSGNDVHVNCKRLFMNVAFYAFPAWFGELILLGIVGALCACAIYSNGCKNSVNFVKPQSNCLCNTYIISE